MHQNLTALKTNQVKSITHHSNFAAFLAALFVSLFLLGAKESFSQLPRWEAPVSASALKNPFFNNAAATAKGKITFELICLPCHGAKGKGDGPAGIALNPMPQDLTSALVQKQTDGAIWWKITNGRPPMAPYQAIITDEQRWQLVNYLRQLKSGTK